jgi:hypothetical protein
MATAVQIIAEAYRQLNEREPTSFSTTAEFPLNIAKDILNKAIREMNRLGNLWFMETSTPLTYGVGVYQYDLTALNIDPKRIAYIRRDSDDNRGELKQYQSRNFLKAFRGPNTITSTAPTAWTKYNSTLELNVIPDRDYELKVYHFRDMPLVATTTDTFLIPERDEDVLTDICMEWLKVRIGQQDTQTALVNTKVKVSPFLVQIESDAGLPLQMPAAF